jgi:glycosyltransferase involved in cell wall biosynthesis
MDYLLKEGVKRIRLWPQGVDARRLRPEKASEEWRERLSDGHPQDKLLLYVGRLAPEKGIERLKAILTDVPGTRLAFVGDGPARSDLEREFCGTPALFTGVLQGEDLARAYASADAFLFPSTTDTLGLAMLEALASGLPVVAARGGASHEIVSDEENGLLYEANSTPSLVSAVRRLFSDEGFRAALSRRARETAEKRDWESSTHTLRGYYEQALGKG